LTVSVWNNSKARHFGTVAVIEKKETTTRILKMKTIKETLTKGKRKVSEIKQVKGITTNV